MACVTHRHEAELEVESLSPVFPTPLSTIKEAPSCSALCDCGLGLVYTQSAECAPAHEGSASSLGKTISPGQRALTWSTTLPT